jgi:hypothetical protein
VEGVAVPQPELHGLEQPQSLPQPPFQRNQLRWPRSPHSLQESFLQPNENRSRQPLKSEPQPLSHVLQVDWQPVLQLPQSFPLRTFHPKTLPQPLSQVLQLDFT